ncbi:uncharacterized protein LOC126573961 [Anopheles aquasalis]|uniref:uncharacterized protein LOC126573961 n=1 Tax=Anopheles aquasalis TaxID=42839 RepID=UPI00215A777D|nr:uncharacterized protein LOC126573961 [Anopheles aquasalis]
MDIPKKNSPGLKWDREQFDTRRPYERKNYEVPFRALPTYVGRFGGVNVKPKECATPSAFARRTAIEEVFHKRNRSTVCARPELRSVGDCVDDVIAGDNISSSGTVRESGTLHRDDSIESSKGKEVSKECYRTFFKARKALLRSELFEEYFQRGHATDDGAVGEDEISEVSDLEQTPEPSRESSQELMFELSEEDSLLADSQSDCESSYYEPPRIVHKDSKPAAVEARETFLSRLRTHYLRKFDHVRDQLEREERERHKQPEPFDEERYMAEYPAVDIKNERKRLFRQSLHLRLEELNKRQAREIRQYPQTVAQFAEYKAALADNTRRLRDEARLVEDYFRNANTPREIPEARLEVKHIREADYGPDHDEPPPAADGNVEETKPKGPPVYHTCMTREEWSRWIGTSVKMEKLKLPKPKLLPSSVPPGVVVDRCLESPIRAYIQGRLDVVQAGASSTAATKEANPKKLVHSLVGPSENRRSAERPVMRDLLFDPTPPESDHTATNQVMAVAAVATSLRPYTDIIEERFRSHEGRRKAKRRMRKSRMPWIEELVDEICRRRRDEGPVQIGS